MAEEVDGTEPMSLRQPVGKWLAVAGLVVGVDQLTKWLAERLLELRESVAVVPGLDLTLLYNSGAAFSLFNEPGGWQRWPLTVFSVAVAGFIIYWLRHLPAHRVWEAAALALVLGGAVGNAIDRIWLGYVRDFVDVYYGAWHWPAFNVADSAISVGAALLVVDLVVRRRGESGI